MDCRRERRLLEADQVAHALQLGHEAIAAARVVVEPADEPVRAKVGVGGVVLQQCQAITRMECPTARAAFYLPMRRASRQNCAAR